MIVRRVCCHLRARGDLRTSTALTYTHAQAAQRTRNMPKDAGDAASKYGSVEGGPQSIV